MHKCHKKIKIIYLILLCMVIISFPLSVKASEKSEISEINDLIEHAAETDEKEVTVIGEAIGERMDRGDYSWVNINDGTNAIGIWLKKQEADVITNYGNYKFKGDTIKISGTFHRACPEHGGEADIHCSFIEVIKKGYHSKEQISKGKVITAVVFFISAIGFSIFLIRVIRKNRN